MVRFEKVNGYEDVNLPQRKTRFSAGYDFEAAEDITIPSYHKLMDRLDDFYPDYNVVTLEEIALATKTTKIKPTLIPTGVKCQMEEDMFLQLSVRSSCPLKNWIILANGVGIIDADYYGNEDNDGHIFFQVINLSPWDIQIKKGDVIGQGIIIPYFITDNDIADKSRIGGFGSTDGR